LNAPRFKSFDRGLDSPERVCFSIERQIAPLSKPHKHWDIPVEEYEADVSEVSVRQDVAGLQARRAREAFVPLQFPLGGMIQVDFGHACLQPAKDREHADGCGSLPQELSAFHPLPDRLLHRPQGPPRRSVFCILRKVTTHRGG
jgi:hypothetical protein